MLFKKILKKIIKKVLSEKKEYLIWYFYDKWTDKEKYWYRWKTCGIRNPDKGFVVFVSFTVGRGVGAAARTAVGNINWAEQNGFIPIILHISQYDFINMNWIEGNIWSKFFYEEYQLEEVLDSKHVYIEVETTHLWDEYKTISEDYYKYVNKGIDYYNSAQHLKENVLKEWEDEVNVLFDGHSKVLGLSLREGFLLASKAGIMGADAHSKPMPLDVTLRRVQELMKDNKCDGIYLASCYSDTVSIFKEVFKDKLIYSDRSRVSYDEHECWMRVNKDYFQNRHSLDYDTAYKMHYIFEQYPQFAFDDNIDIVSAYLKETYALSKCNVLMGDFSSAIQLAQIWNKGEYESVVLMTDRRGELY